MSSIRMVTTICTRSWTGSPKICSWIAASNRRSAAVLAQIGKVVSNRNYFDDCREYMADRLGRREPLVAEAAGRAWRFQTLDATTHGGT